MFSCGVLLTSRHFYPRSPCGERLLAHELAHVAAGISIHALLAESDAAGRRGQDALADFYPRSPCGERHKGYGDAGASWQFLSTLSLRRATGRCGVVLLDDGISIHALLAESDVFQVFVAVCRVISIHALLAESD